VAYALADEIKITDFGYDLDHWQP